MAASATVSRLAITATTRALWHATVSTVPRFQGQGRPPGQATGRGRTMTEAAVSFAGNLTDDPEVRYTHDGIARDMVGSGSYLVMDTTSAQTASARVAGQ